MSRILARGGELADGGADGFHVPRCGRVFLDDHRHVRHAQVCLAGVIARLVTWAVRVDEAEMHGRGEERKVAVPAVPHDHVGFPHFLNGSEFERDFSDTGQDVKVFAVREDEGLRIAIAFESASATFRSPSTGG